VHRRFFSVKKTPHAGAAAKGYRNMRDNMNVAKTPRRFVIAAILLRVAGQQHFSARNRYQATAN
jgi:hypothetical protein